MYHKLRTTYAVERDGVELTKLAPAGGQDRQLQMVSTAEIKMTLTGTFRPNEKVNYMIDRLCPVMELDGQKYPLGRYIITDAVSRVSEAGVETVEITAYDLTYLLQTSVTEARYYIAADTGYKKAIETVLIEAGAGDYTLDDTAAVLAADREWEPYTSRLTIINELLADINYNSLWMDLNGVLRGTAYRQASAEQIDRRYKVDEDSMIYAPHTSIADYFNRANVFVATVDTPGAEEPLVAIAVNDSPDSPFSTVNQRRRIVNLTELDTIADQKCLQQYVDDQKYKGMLTSVETVWSTGPAPVHQVSDIVALDKPGVSGIYQETEWTLQLDVPGEMEHKGKRVVTL